ncbi:hypothetical protein AAFC00_002062 [Neodothiora populina]|uniref:AB hydrolase-1 domain-containing protein n=1 Tax=Neodothiora populina TaxID=2781224 RepID=A0ABR3PGG2_9PEZI
MTSVQKTLEVPHLGGTTANYWLSSADASKPTLVLIHSFATSVDIYRPQFSNNALTGRYNLLAVDVLGHGKTRTKSPHWTYWDTAIVNLQVLEQLGLKAGYVPVGTSQGGFVAVRMALLAPQSVLGIVLLGTSLDYESERTMKLRCWDAGKILTGIIDALSTTGSMPDFEPDDNFCDLTIDTGFGSGVSSADRDFWRQAIKTNWGGDAGRRQARMAAICLRDRDGLHGRVFDVLCPVLWMQGTADVVYSVENATEEIKLFVNSPDTRLQVVDGGQHYLSFSNPDEVNAALLDFATKCANEA